MWHENTAGRQPRRCSSHASKKGVSYIQYKAESVTLFFSPCILTVHRVSHWTKEEGETEGTGRRRRRHQQLVGDLKKTSLSFKLKKKEAPDLTVRRSRFGSGCRHVISQLMR